MAIQNIVVLMVLISMEFYNPIQGTVVRGVDIPLLNSTKMAGKWFMVASYEENQPVACSKTVVMPQSDDSFMVNVTHRLQPGTEGNNSNFSDATVTESYNVSLSENPLIIDKDENGDEIVEIVFDVDYNSHMAVYGTNSVDALSNGDDGYIFIVSRQPTLQEGIIEKVKQSIFYQQGVKPGLSFQYVNPDYCAEYLVDAI